MENKFSNTLVLDSLEEINGIKFSSREIDIMASILSGKSVKSIASFVSIAPRTLAEGKNDLESHRNQAIGYLKQALRVVATGFPANSPHRVPLEIKLKKLQAQ